MTIVDCEVLPVSSITIVQDKIVHVHSEAVHVHVHGYARRPIVNVYQNVNVNEMEPGFPGICISDCWSWHGSPAIVLFWTRVIRNTKCDPA